MVDCKIKLNTVGVSNIGYTSAAEKKSREGWRFAKQIRPDLDWVRQKYHGIWPSGTTGRMALTVTSRRDTAQAVDWVISSPDRS